MISFQWLWVLWCLPLPLIMRKILPPAQTQSQAALQTPFFESLQQVDGGLITLKSRNKFKASLPWLIWILLVTATARPMWIGDAIQLPASGRDLMLAVDVSPSMQEEDLTLNDEPVDRLTVLKSILSPFIEQRKGDRLGLILFGSQAYLQTPLTFDRTTVATLLMESQIGIAGDATAIGDAIGLALKRLIDRPSKKKVLILVTDGANTAGQLSPRKAAELAAQKGLTIYTVGVGADEMLVPGLMGTSFGSFRKNPSRDLDEQMLNDVAQLSGGKYFRAKSSKELAGIYTLLDKLEPVEIETETFRPSQSLFHWPLAAALIISFIVGLLS
ncbi:MAG: VWA domain-containing protein, partial [Gammaproteobacteria bacterium]|nr:VWA domain-containing protein [Gammaproteobacteria bacterium]